MNDQNILQNQFFDNQQQQDIFDGSTEYFTTIFDNK